LTGKCTCDIGRTRMSGLDDSGLSPALWVECTEWQGESGGPKQQILTRGMRSYRPARTGRAGDGLVTGRRNLDRALDTEAQGACWRGPVRMMMPVVL
jgi:hypothetical protein